MAKKQHRDTCPFAGLLGGATVLIDELHEILMMQQDTVREIRSMLDDDSINLSDRDRLLMVAVQNWKQNYATATQQDQQSRTQQCGQDSADEEINRDTVSSQATH